MKKVNLLSLAAIIALGACTHYSDDLSSLDGEMKAPTSSMAMSASPQDIAPAAGTPVSGEFTRELARGYYDLARYENDKAYDYKASKNFTAKAMTAAKGQVPVPSKVSAYDIPSERADELNDARSQLIAALKGRNTSANADMLARAQCRYECWLERAEEAPDEDHYAQCKGEFEAAMASLTMPAAGTPATVYDISFAQNSAIIDPSSATTIELIAQFFKDPNNAAYTASMTGFAESGANADAVTTSRVTAVRDALVAKGVDASRLNPLVAPAATPELSSKVQVALIAPDSVSAPYGSTTQKFVPVTPRTVSVTETPAPAIVAPAPVSTPTAAPSKTN